MSKDDYSEDDVMQSPWMRWGKVGDSLQGTLIRVFKKMQISLKTGQEEEVTVYELKCDSGTYHQLDDNKKAITPPVQIGEGELYKVADHFTIHDVMKNVKIGKKLKIAFTETKASQKKGNAPMKIRKVYSKGTMDEDWLKEQEAELGKEEEF